MGGGGDKMVNDKLSTLLDSLDIFPSSELDIEVVAAAAAAAAARCGGGGGDGGESESTGAAEVTVSVSNKEEKEGVVPIDGEDDDPSMTVVRDTDAMARLALLGGGF